MSVLTKDDRQTLASYECVIKQGLETFVEVGTAFAAIRDGRLYRETHDTFEDYCHERWMLSRSYVNRVIAAAVATSEMVPIVTMPQNESQVRPLLSLPQEDRSAAWQEALEDSGGEPTAAKVQEVVDRRKPNKPIEENPDTANDKEDFMQAIQDVIDEWRDSEKLTKAQIVYCVYEMTKYAKAI